MKKIMRSVLLLALAGVMVFSMAACGEKKVEENPVNPPVVDETDISESELKSEVVEASLSIADIVDTLSATYGGEYNATMKIENDVMETLLGISSDMYEDAFMAQAPMSAHCDMLVVIRAVEDKAAEVEKLLNDYRDSRINDTLEYPANQPKIAASVVDVKYDFIIFRILGANYVPETDETGAVIEKEDEEEIINTFYVQETEKGTIALNDLYEMGFTAMSEEEREVNGFDALYPAEEVTEEVAPVEKEEEVAEDEEVAEEVEEVAEEEKVEEEATETEKTEAEKAVEEVGEAVAEAAEKVAEGAGEVAETEKTEAAE